MNRLSALLIAGLSLALGTGGFAAEGSPQSVKVEVLMVAVKPSTSLTLLPRLRREKTSQAAFQELWRMIKNSEADLISWPSVRVSTGERSLSEAAGEVRYPTEPEFVHGPPLFGNPPPPPRFNPFRYSQYGWGIVTPQAFETRSTGSILEVEASVTESGLVELSLVARDVRLVKLREFTGVKALNGSVGTKVRPEFAVNEFTGALSVQNNRWRLLSSFVEKTPVPRVVLFLLHAVSTTNSVP